MDWQNNSLLYPWHSSEPRNSSAVASMGIMFGLSLAFCICPSEGSTTQMGFFRTPEKVNEMQNIN